MNPNHTAANVSTLLAQGREKQLQGELAPANLLYEQALALSPRDADVLYLLGTVAVMAQNHVRALQLLDSAFAQNPGHGPCACLRGHVLHKSGRLEDALQALELAATLMPGHPIAWKYRMEVLLDRERPREVVHASDQWLAESPQDLQAHFFRGNALVMMRRYADALQSYKRALEIDPGHVEAHYNLIQTWIRVDEDDPRGDALEHALQAARLFLSLKPQEPKAHWLYAALRKEQGNVDAAEPHYQEVLRLDPTHRTAPYELATCWLSQGKWTQGWEMFEHRASIRPAMPDTKILQGKPWNGEPLAGKSILLFSEGGFGDTLNFARYIPAVGGMAAHVGVLVQPELRDLLMAARAGAGSTQLARSYDYHCGLMSLPRLFGTRPDSVPLASGYLRADEAKTRHWRDRLQVSGRLRVGLAWSGNPKFLNDHNRSIPLAMLAGLLDVAGVDYFCLQQVVRDSERETFSALPQLAFLGDELRDFSDTAALCNAMDLVISVDTSVAHLAGALGKPVWIMLPFAAEYRWMMHREDTPWYVQARLFRQSTRAMWADVVARVRTELQLLRSAHDATAR